MKAIHYETRMLRELSDSCQARKDEGLDQCISAHLYRFTVKDGDNPRQDMEVIPSGTRDCLSHVPLGITSDSDPETVGATGGSPRANAIRPYRCPRTRARRHVKAGLKPAPTRCDLLESESVLAGSSRKAVDGSAPMPGTMHPENGTGNFMMVSFQAG